MNPQALFAEVLSNIKQDPTHQARLRARLALNGQRDLRMEQQHPLNEPFIPGGTREEAFKAAGMNLRFPVQKAVR